MGNSLSVEFKKFLKSIDNSQFNAAIGSFGGYLNFENSGKRGSIKSFTLSLESFLSGLNDIKNNISDFGGSSNYNEQSWRDLGAKHFSDLTLNSMITVQTKPTFTTFSKIIAWANNDVYKDDQKIDLSLESLDVAINKVSLLIEEFSPKAKVQRVHGFGFSILAKPFILLAGVSGTGKSRFVRKQAEAIGSINKHYQLISVRPDWHEPSDLLGYVSRISGTEKYIVTDALKFMVSAWCDACDFNNSNKNYLANKPSAEISTFWLCLDEMNLAPVEQYFADYLSVIETRKWEDDIYTCDPIIKADVIKFLDENAAKNLRSELGIANAEYDSLWNYFSEVGIPIPPNLIVVGTVNMDETTHGFSRKVIDRAFTLDFGQFFPNDFDAFFEPTSIPVIFNFPTLSQATKADLNNVVADPDGQKSLAFLKGINEILKGTLFELAYRALNELYIAVICINPKDDIELQAVWDDFLMTKVLPRIEGDDDKLKNHNELSNKNILTALNEYVKQALGAIYEAELRPDFFRLNVSTNEKEKIPCRSKAKLEWMLTRLNNNGFTTFWP